MSKGGALLARAKSKAKTEAIHRGVRSTAERDDLVRLGSVYGGWWVPRNLLNADSICYLAGVGEDASFDLALIAEIGCQVWAIDPTPRAIAFAETITEPRFHFIPEGLWCEDTELRFYAPADPSHVSHSAVNAQRTKAYFTSKVRTLRSFMDSLGHDRLDLLKMDIEGAEPAVLDDMLAHGPMPRVLCVEFDTPEPVWTIVRRVKNLRAAGYDILRVEGRNVALAQL